MASSHISDVVRHLRTAALRQDGAGLTDGQLLENFLVHREGEALAALVRRHGPMVWGVCRRVLYNHHDAEDAFQAAFLVLVRKAASVRPRELVANWLYGVAYHTALKARATAARRGSRERQVADMPEPEAARPELGNDLRPLLDQELSRLPDGYRVVLVLCDLEGKTRKEAARQLGLAEGTVGSRLARARALLAKRLARHGLAVSGAALAALSASAASAGVPAAVVSATIEAASLWAAGQAASVVVSARVAALTEGVLKDMLLNKLKIVTAMVVLGVLGCYAAGLLAGAGTAAGQSAPGAEAKPNDSRPAEARENTLRCHALINRVDVVNNALTAFTLRGTYAGVVETLLKSRLAETDSGKRSMPGLANIPVARDARITDAGRAIKLSDLAGNELVVLELGVGGAGLEIVGIEKGAAAATPKVTVLPLRSLKADEAAKLLAEIIGQEKAGVVIEPHERGNAVLIRGDAETTELLRRVLGKIDVGQKAVPDSGTVAQKALSALAETPAATKAAPAKTPAPADPNAAQKAAGALPTFTVRPTPGAGKGAAETPLTFTVLPLKHLQAGEAARVLLELIGPREGVIIGTDERSNSLVIRANADVRIEQIRMILDKIDEIEEGLPATPREKKGGGGSSGKSRGR